MSNGNNNTGQPLTPRGMSEPCATVHGHGESAVLVCVLEALICPLKATLLALCLGRFTFMDCSDGSPSSWAEGDGCHRIAQMGAKGDESVLPIPSLLECGLTVPPEGHSRVR